MSDDIQKETERIHQGIVESLSFSEVLAKRDAEIERLRGVVAARDAEVAALKNSIPPLIADNGRLREENDALKIRIGTYYAGNTNGGIVKQLEYEIERLRGLVGIESADFDLDWNRLRSGDYRAPNPEHQDVFDMVAAKNAEIERLRGLLREWRDRGKHDRFYTTDFESRVREVLGE